MCLIAETMQRHANNYRSVNLEKVKHASKLQGYFFEWQTGVELELTEQWLIMLSRETGKADFWLPIQEQKVFAILQLNSN